MKTNHGNTQPPGAVLMPDTRLRAGILDLFVWDLLLASARLALTQNLPAGELRRRCGV